MRDFLMSAFSNPHQKENRTEGGHKSRCFWVCPVLSYFGPVNRPSPKVFLTLISLLLVVLFFILPHNYAWLQRLLFYAGGIPAQAKRMAPEQRLEDRFESRYRYSVNIRDSFLAKGGQLSQTILLPPTNHFRDSAIEYHVPEPAVFYYFTGVRTVWANSPEAEKATWEVQVKGQSLLVRKVEDQKEIKKRINQYRERGVSL